MGLNGFIERLAAGRWIAGPSESDAIRVARKFKAVGIESIINYLGEELTSGIDIHSTVETYLQLISLIKRERLHSDIAVKLTQLGLSSHGHGCHDNLDRIVKHAKKEGVFVWIDMEAENFAEDTIREYISERAEGNVGICIQAYLASAKEQLRRVTKRNGIVRLVKGAYPLSKKTFKTHDEITRNYERLMLYLFRNSKRFTIATHDLAIVENAIKLNKKYGRDITYAMLNGVRNRYLKKLAESNYKTAVYIPFGERWVDYSYRRLKEAGHATIILKSIFERQGV